MELLFIAFYTGIVILAAWLVIFLPVDLIVPAHSRLRRPGPAALCGFLAAFSLVALLFAWVVMQESQAHGWLEAARRTFDADALPYVLGACITGTAAAWLRAQLDRFFPPPTPCTR
jgi:biotin transporter BioY